MTRFLRAMASQASASLPARRFGGVSARPSAPQTLAHRHQRRLLSCWRRPPNATWPRPASPLVQRLEIPQRFPSRDKRGGKGVPRVRRELSLSLQHRLSARLAVVAASPERLTVGESLQTCLPSSGACGIASRPACPAMCRASLASFADVRHMIRRLGYRFRLPRPAHALPRGTALLAPGAVCETGVHSGPATCAAVVRTAYCRPFAHQV